MLHRGLWNRGFHSVDDAFDYGVRGVVHWGTRLAERPVSDGVMPQHGQNARIRSAYRLGAAVPDLVREFQISSQRVYQILREN